MINRLLKKVILKNEFFKKMFLKKKEEPNKLMHKELLIFLKKNKDFKIAKYVCPCCGYPTLKTKGQFEICPICLWEDFGQGEKDKYIDYGGPNGNSLLGARYNFTSRKNNYSQKYQEQVFNQYNDFLLKSNNIIKLFDKMIAINKINKNIYSLIKEIKKSIFLANILIDKKILSRRKKYFNIIRKCKIKEPLYTCCPCCGYPTILFEDYPDNGYVCMICKWRDYRQWRDDTTVKLILGGNKNLSLEQAMINFKKTFNYNGIKLNYEEKIKIKNLMNLFDKSLNTGKIEDLKKAFKEIEKINKKYIFSKNK